MGWWGLGFGVSLELAPLAGQLLFCRDLGNKGISGVAILDTDNDGRNDILTFGRHLDIYTLLPPETATAPSLNCWASLSE